MTSPATTPSANAPFDFLDLRAQFATIHDEVMQAVARVFDGQHFILGPEVKLLEEEIAAKLGAKFTVGCASGTDASALATAMIAGATVVASAARGAGCAAVVVSAGAGMDPLGSCWQSLRLAMARLPIDGVHQSVTIFTYQLVTWLGGGHADGTRRPLRTV